MAANRDSKSSVGSIVIELGHSNIHVVICDQGGGDRSVRCLSVPWRVEATSLQSTLGVNEITKALEQLVDAEQLQGQAVSFLLDGDHCVTRHVRGTSQAVADRLDELESRCSRYLLLGHGRKSAARQIVAEPNGEFRGYLSVANQRTLQALCTACDHAGLVLESVSATCVVLSALIGQAYPAGSRSGLLLRPRPTGVDAAIIDDGQLLLEFHPLNNLKLNDVGSFVKERRAILERFFQHHASRNSGSLRNLFLCGDDQTVATLTAAFDGSDFVVSSIESQISSLDWPLPPNIARHTYCGGLGASLGGQCDAVTSDRPNLLHGLDLSQSHSTLSLIAKTLWPVAAAILLAIGLGLMSAREHMLIAYHQDIIDQHQGLTDSSLNLQSEIDVSTTHLTHLKSIQRRLTAPALGDCLTTFAKCMADDASLESFHLQADGTLSLRGSCGSEHSVYEFVESLRGLSMIENASLQGAETSGSGTDALIEFNVHAALRQRTDLAMETGR